MNSFKNKNIFFVGIKGTGMSALADLCKSLGANVCGSDVAEKFYTDEVLKRQGISFVESFDEELLPNNTDIVIHSSAYQTDKNPQLIKATNLGILTLEYTKALGEFSRAFYSIGICGVHGKTTTTALIGSLMQAMNLPGSVLVGSALAQFDNRSIWSGGWDFFVAETCEYKRHFLNFCPSGLLLTGVEMDHLDYFKNLDDIYSAFIEYGLTIADGGFLIYCVDNQGACYCANRIKELAQKENKTIDLISYGFSPSADFSISSYTLGDGKNSFKISGIDKEFELFIPGKHLIENSAAAVALIHEICKRKKINLPLNEQALVKGIAAFKGSRRRSELVGEIKGITIIDDYAHHPSAIDTTLKGYKAFYPNRRIIVDFMSHTYSRTQGLLEEFASAFSDADIVLLNRIYASAREKSGGITGRTLYERCKCYHKEVYYFDDYLDALPFLLKTLKNGDLFITMGAGDNWQLGVALCDALKGEKND